MWFSRKKNRYLIKASAGFWLSVLVGGFVVTSYGQHPGSAHDTPSNPGQSQTGSPQAKPSHSHKMVEVPAGQPIPTVNLILHPDAMNGWNLEVKVTNFVFAPDRVNTKGTSVNEGHAHLYVDGKKVARLYGSWHHLPALPPGDHKITVTLNTNDHGELVYGGKPIQATEIIQVPAK
ncbi:MAG: hypothetical protein NW224_20415 [Leptolyngbyaceae cyanobacterium bins.302]|nr:hypothetical protein [Leptolyngbyaceae cyanobacterium bins.302]